MNETELGKMFLQANNLYNNKEYEKASVIYLELLKNLNESTDKIRIALTRYNLGVSYMRIDEYDKAIEQFNNSTKQELIEKGHINNSYYNLGVCYYFKKDLPRSYKYFKKHLELCNKYKIEEDIEDVKNKLRTFKKILIVKDDNA